MSVPMFNTKSPTIKRILKEASELSTNPDPTLHAAPMELDIFEWHFTLAGPPNSPYAHGIYHGRIILPPTYPLRPPSFRFLTPSGRFEVNREICLSISGHHEETWQPAWGIRTAIWALRAFMEAGAKGQVGGMEMDEVERKLLARESRRWRCEGCGGRTNEEILKEEEERFGEKEERDSEGMRENVLEELEFGFGDEMEASATTAKKPSSLSSLLSLQPLPSSQYSSTSLGLTSAPPSPAPLLTISPTSTPSSSSPPQPRPSELVPVWIDKAIAGLVTGLAVMVIRKIIN